MMRTKATCVVRSTILLTLVLAGCSRQLSAGSLSVSIISGSQFRAAFDVQNPVAAFVNNGFPAPGNVSPQYGFMETEVFQGVKGGPDQGIYAYLYQIWAPGRTSINNFLIPDFTGALTKATFGDTTAQAIEITSQVGAGATSIGGFTTLGKQAPYSIFQGTSGGLLVNYDTDKGGAPLPGATTAYIVGVFSTTKPQLSNILVNGKYLVEGSAYVAVPEPSSWVLMTFALAGFAGLCQRPRRAGG